MTYLSGRPGLGPLTSMPEGATYRMLARRRRRINPKAGRALEILGHAIEYLADEFLFEYHDAPLSWRGGRIESIQLLMAINRQVYLECPEIPNFEDRGLAFLRSIRAWIMKLAPSFGKDQC